MKILASGLSAAVLVLSNVPAYAAERPAAPSAAAQAAEFASMQEWMAATVVWSEGYNQLTSRQIDTVAWLLDSADTLAAKLEAGGPQAARPWADAWAQQARARLAGDMEVYAGLSGQAPRFPSNLPRPPEVRSRIESINRSAEQVGNMMISANYASNAYIEIFVAAASGREEDLLRLDDASLGLLLAQLEAEIVMLQANIEGTTGPNMHFGRIQITTNRAMIRWISHKKRLFAGEPAEAAAAARDIREQATLARREVALMQTSITDLKDRMNRERELMATPLGAMLAKLAESLERSAALEIKVAGAIDELAAAVQAGDAPGEEAASIRLETLAGQRIALDSERRALVTQGGG